MSVEYVLDKIRNHIYGDEIQKNILLDYLSGERKDEPLYLDKISLYFYNMNVFWRELESEEEKKVFLQFLELLSRKLPETFGQGLQNYPEKYELYHLAGIAEKAVEREYTKTITGFLNYHYYDSQYFDEVWKRSVEELQKYYPNLVDRLILNSEKINGHLQLGSMLLVFYRAEATKDQDLLEKAERMTMSLLNGVFGEKKVKETISQYGDGEILEAILNRKKFPLHVELYSDQFYQILYSIFHLYSMSSKGLKEMFRIFLILLPVPTLVTKIKEDETVLDLFKKLEIPQKTEMKFCCYCMRRYGMGKYKKRLHYPVLDEMRKKDFQGYLETMTSFWKERDPGFLTMLALLLKTDSLSEEQKTQWIQRAEQELIETMRECQSKEPVFTFLLPYGPEFDSFEFLRKEEPLPIVAFTKFSLYKEKEKSLAFNAIYLMDYSIVARNLIVLIFQKQYRYAISGMDFFNNYAMFSRGENQTLFERLNQERNIPLETICFIYIAMAMYQDSEVPEWEEQFLKFLLSKKTEAEEGIETFSYESEEMVFYLKLLYEKDNGFDDTALTKAFFRKSKPVANYAENCLKTKEKEVRPAVEELVKAKSKIASDAAMRLIRIWDNEKIEEELSHLHSIESLTEYIEKRYSKNNEKNAPYAKEIEYGCVRAVDSEEVLSEKLMKYFVSEYIMLKDVYLIKTCKKIQDCSNLYDLRALIKQIFEMWIAEGAVAKYKNILVPFSLTAGESQMAELQRQIDFWSENSKPSLAAFAVQALCMNGSKTALLMADTMSKKHKNKKVKTAALEALQKTAEDMKITREELDDFIVPDFGFQKGKPKIFDYGQRKFHAVLNEKLEVTLFDEEGKQIKSLPKASAKYQDKEEMVLACKEDLKVLKKQLKMILDSQKPRISRAIMTGRKWSVKNWRNLFIENPVMHSFAIGLIWVETDENGKQKQTFRYMEDGSFNTVEEEEYNIQENSFIHLLHPVDLEKEELEQWIEQLQDYEIMQPVDQLNIPVCTLSEAEKQKEDWKIYQGKKVYGATFKSIAAKHGFSPIYEGDYAGCLYIDEDTGLMMKIHTSPFYASDYNAVTKLGIIDFYKIESKAALPLGQIPEKMLSFAMMVGNAITAKEIKD